MIICGHDGNSKQFTVIFEDIDKRLWKVFVERYGDNQLTREHGLYETIGNGLYNPRFKASLRLLLELLQRFIDSHLSPQQAQMTIHHICMLLEVDNEEDLMKLLQGD